MKRKSAIVVPAFGLLFAVGACRGLVGIEDLGLDAGTDASSTTDGATTTDGSTKTDGATTTEAGPPEGGPPPPSACGVDPDTSKACDAPGVDCRRCCKMSCAALHTLEGDPGTRSCLCSGGCPDCASDPYCTANAANAQQQICAACIDGKFKAGQCTGACTSADCKAGLACLDKCP